MSETISSIEGARNTEKPKNPEGGSETTAMAVAFQELAKKLGVQEGTDIPAVLHERETNIAEREKGGAVIHFPARTRDGERMLGNEIGLAAGELIGEHIQNAMKVGSGDTISSMEKEGAPKVAEESLDLAKIREETASMSDQKSARLNALIPRIEELEKNPGNEQEVGDLQAKLGEIYSEEKTAKVAPKPAEATSQEPSPLWVPEEDPVLIRIEKDADQVRQEFKSKLRAFRNHADTSTNSHELQGWVNNELHKLNEERTKHIEDKMKSLPLERVAELANESVDTIRDPSVRKITAPVEIRVFARKLLEPHEQKERRDKVIEKRSVGAATSDAAAHIKAMGEEILTNPEVAPLTPSPTEQSAVSVNEQATKTSLPEESAKQVKPEESPKSAYEKAMERIAHEDPARAERLLAAVGGATPEMREKMEKILGAVEIQTQKIEAETKTKGEEMLGVLRSWGDRYRKLPLTAKLAIGSALIGGAFVTGGTGALGSIFALGLTARQGMVGLGAFVTIESLGHRWIEKSDLWKGHEEMGKNISTAGALISGILFGGAAKGFLEYYDALHVETSPIPSAQETIPQETIPAPAENSLRTEYAQKMESVREVLKNESALEHSYTVKNGDSLWNILEKKIPAIQALGDEGRQSNAIANIIEQIRKDPEGFGITSGNVDNLTAGDMLNLEKVQSVLQNTKISVGDTEMGILERAEGLTDTEVSAIEANNEKLSSWVAEHPGEQLTTETTKDILGDSSQSVDAETSPHESFDNIRKSIEEAEAISTKAGEIFHADIQEMFGSKGLFGYGFLGTNGERSVDWLDLKDRPVQEVLSKTFDQAPTGEESIGSQMGIDSWSAVDKMKGYIKMLMEKSGATPNVGESVEHFMKRGIETIVKK